MLTKDEATNIVKSGDKIATKIIWVVGIILLITLFRYIDWGFLKSEITAYGALCTHEVSGDECNDPMFTYPASHYKIHAKNQTVINWTEGFDEIEKLPNCAVINRKNWTCEWNDKSATFGFRNGKFWKIEDPTNLTANLGRKEYYTSKYKWLNTKCQDDPINIYLCMTIITLLEG